MDNEHYCSREEVGGRGWRGEGSEYERWVGGLLYMNNIARRGKERESLGILASLSRMGGGEFGDFSVPQPHKGEREREFGDFSVPQPHRRERERERVWGF